MPLPRAPSITDDTLSTMGIPSAAIFRATISDPPANTRSRLCVELGRLIPQFGHERSSLNLGRPFVPLNVLVVHRPPL